MVHIRSRDDVHVCTYARVQAPHVQQVITNIAIRMFDFKPFPCFSILPYHPDQTTMPTHSDFFLHILSLRQINDSDLF